MPTRDTATTTSGTTRTPDPLRVHSFPGGSGRVVPPLRDGRGDRLLLVYCRGAGTIRHGSQVLAAPAGCLCFLSDGTRSAFWGFDDGGVVLVELPAEVAVRARDRVDTVTGRVTIQYERTDALNLPAGTDPFEVAKTALLTGLTVGEKVRFRLESHQIAGIRPFVASPAGGPPAAGPPPMGPMPSIPPKAS